MTDKNVITPMEALDIVNRYEDELWFTYNCVGVAQFDGAINIELGSQRLDEKDVKQGILSLFVDGVLFETDLNKATVICVGRTTYLQDDSLELLIHLDCVDTIVRLIFVMYQFDDPDLIEQKYLKDLPKEE